MTMASCLSLGPVSARSGSNAEEILVVLLMIHGLRLGFLSVVDCDARIAHQSALAVMASSRLSAQAFDIDVGWFHSYTARAARYS